MVDLEGLFARFDAVAKDISKLSRSGKKIIVVTHIDADGLASGAATFAALSRAGANVVLRCVPDLDKGFIAELQSQKYDFHIFTDLGSTLVAELEAAFDGRFLVIDHHQISEADMGRATVVNAWRYGFDGGREACSSSMAYFYAKSTDASNRDLSPLAVVGAVADRQDVGPGRSLTGLNRVALEEAQSAGLVFAYNDLMLTGRETRPVHEAVALTSTPYLPGLTGSKDAVLSVLHQAGLRLKDGGTWRTISSLDSTEKMKLTEVIAGIVGPTGGATDAIASLVGEVYTLQYEDPFTPLHDAREFATLLNSCGRMGANAVGISICLGDRSEALDLATKTLGEYRIGINKALQALSNDPSRTVVNGALILIRGEGVVEEKLLGPVTSILASTLDYRGKVLVASATSGESELKISSRVGDAFEGSANLGLIMRGAAEAVGGTGGGHAMAAGAKIPSSAADSFFKLVTKEICR